MISLRLVHFFRKVRLCTASSIALRSFIRVFFTSTPYHLNHRQHDRFDFLFYIRSSHEEKPHTRTTRKQQQQLFPILFVCIHCTLHALTRFPYAFRTTKGCGALDRISGLASERALYPSWHEFTQRYRRLLFLDPFFEGASGLE